MLKFLSFYLFLILLIIPTISNSHTLEDIRDSEDFCTEECESIHEEAIESLSCDRDEINRVASICINNARTVRNGCLRPCSDERSATNEQCSQAFKASKKDCRDTKTDEKKDCRDAKKIEKEACKEAKTEEKLLCKELSGQEKRDCKKQARQNKKDCKKLARDTKKICKEEARDEKNDCIETAEATRTSCLETVSNTYAACEEACLATYDQSCVEERRQRDECEAEAEPFDQALNRCENRCEWTADREREGHNGFCPNDHGGEQGVIVNIYNGSGGERTLYIGNSNQAVATIDNRNEYQHIVQCEQGRLEFSFRRANGDETHEAFIENAPCCEEPRVDPIILNESGN